MPQAVPTASVNPNTMPLASATNNVPMPNDAEKVITYETIIKILGGDLTNNEGFLNKSEWTDSGESTRPAPK